LAGAGLIGAGLADAGLVADGLAAAGLVAEGLVAEGLVGEGLVGERLGKGERAWMLAKLTTLFGPVFIPEAPHSPQNRAKCVSCDPQ
jgi:hypothetical protein